MSETKAVRSTCEIELMVTPGRRAEGDKPAVAPEVRRIPPNTKFNCPVGSLEDLKRANAIVDVDEVTAAAAAATAPTTRQAPTTTVEEPSREDLVAKAEALGIKVGVKWKAATIEAKIADAEAALSDDPL